MSGASSSLVAAFPLPAPRSGTVDVLVIAAEHSGDQNAARMLRGFLSMHPELSVCALGGPQLAASGAQLLKDLTASSVIGFVDTLKHLSYFRRLLQEIVVWIERHRPRLICFVDSSGLNLRIAEQLARRGLLHRAGGPLRAVYYISPQIWASRAKRRFRMAELLDAIAVIFPFEVECYQDTHLAAEFVGHPFLAEDYVAPVSYDAAGPVLLLPGSRTKAVERIFPLMVAGYAQNHSRPGVVIYPSERIRQVLERVGVPANVTMVPAGKHVRASAVLTTSGTMSMHCALAGIPGAVLYKASWLEYWLGRMIVTVPYLGIANLLLKRPMYPEFIQGAARPDVLAEQLRQCWTDPSRLSQTQKDACALRALLGKPSAGSASDWLARQWAAFG